MDAVTKKVRTMYESYPYPSYGVPSFGSLNHDIEQLFAVAGVRRPNIQGLRILDAGCGTGDKTAGCALMYPHVNIHAIDLSTASINYAKAIADKAGCRNIHFTQDDIMSVDLKEKEYDIIISMGVVMLLSDPVRGLANIATGLAPNGLLSLYLYNTAGRTEVKAIQKAVTLLNEDKEDLEDRMKVAIQLTKELHHCPYYKDFLKRMDYLSKRHRGADPKSKIARIADQLAHVHERTFSLGEVFEMLDAADLEFVGMLDDHLWQLENIIENADLLSRAEKLDLRRRHYLIESLRGPLHEHRLLARPKEASDINSEPANLLAHDRPIVRRALLQTSPRFRCNDLQRFETPVVGFVNRSERYTLSPAMIALLEHCDGYNTMEKLCALLNSERDEIDEAIGRLISMHLLRLQHPDEETTP